MHRTCTLQIKSLIQQERPRPQEQNDERPVSLHSIKAHLHSWSIAKTWCCNALTRFCQTAILPHSISPAPQACDLLLWTIRPVESLKWGWEWQTDVHKNASTVLKKKHNVLHLSALNADGWDLNGVFWCIILNRIIRNYRPYAMLLWQLRGHSHLHKHATGIMMDWGCDGASAEVLCSRSAHPVGLSVEITHFFWQPNIDAFAYHQVILNYIHQWQHILA